MADLIDDGESLAVEQLLGDIIRRRRSGEILSDQRILDEHPSFRAALSGKLSALRAVSDALGDSASQLPSDIAASPRMPFIAERYEVLREINHGGQAVIFLARDSETNANVAIKVLRTGALADERERQRFEREAQILSQLDHPNIVAILDRGHTPDDLLYLVMNYIPGEPLAAEKLLAQPLVERLAMFVSICRTVNVAHERQIVHRDLKPSNIRIDDRGQPHVLDFGLAVSQESLFASMTVTGQFLGTFLWASPEQAEGNGEITCASDVYSLGVILYQLATGGAFPPQVFSVVSEAIERRGTGGRGTRPFRRPHAGHASIPSGLKSIINRCLLREPADRFASAAELANAIEEFLASPATPNASRSSSLALSLSVVALAAALIIWFTRSNWHSTAGQPTHIVNGRPTLRINGRELLWIPPGEADLGAAPDAPWRMADEQPHHFTISRGVYMSGFEVDQDWYAQVMGIAPRIPADAGQNPKSQEMAVVNVTWYDAQEFCRRLSLQTGLNVRLPTEDEWEYAARAGVTSPYPDYIDPIKMTWPLVSRHANFNDRASPLKARDERYDDGAATVSFGVKYMGNNWELTNMFGNVWEWTADPYRPDLSKPASGADPPASGPVNISTRGGSWCDDPITFRYSNRNPLPPDFKQDNLGFRIVCEEP